MDKFVFEITAYYQGQTDTTRIFAPDKETAIKQVTKGWVKGVEILKVEQKTFTPAKTGKELNLPGMKGWEKWIVPNVINQ